MHRSTTDSRSRSLPLAVLPCLRGVVLIRWMTWGQLVLGYACSRGARQGVKLLPVARHLERTQSLRRPRNQVGEVELGAVTGDDEGLDVVLCQLRWHADDSALDDARMRDDGVL